MTCIHFLLTTNLNRFSRSTMIMSSIRTRILQFLIDGFKTLLNVRHCLTMLRFSTPEQRCLTYVIRCATNILKKALASRTHKLWWNWKSCKLTRRHIQSLKLFLVGFERSRLEQTPEHLSDYWKLTDCLTHCKWYFNLSTKRKGTYQ